jgi:NPCBM/NEW2 domain-containing protein
MNWQTWWRGLDRTQRIFVAGSIAGVVSAVVAILGLWLAGSSPPGGGRPTATTAVATDTTSSTSAPLATASSEAPSQTTIAALTTSYIDEMTGLADPYDSSGVAKINGDPYPHSQGAGFCFGSNQRNWEYDLGRKFSRFRATIGLSDSSTSKALVRYEIVGDEQPIYKKDVRLGQAVSVDVPVQNVLRLRLKSTLLSKEGACGAASAEWGEARVEA